MNRISRKLYATENMLQPLKEITLNSDYEIINGFIKILIKRKNKFYIITEKGDLIKFPTKSVRELEDFLNLLYQYDKLIYESLFNGEVFKIWLRKTSITYIQRCRVIPINKIMKVA